MLEFPYNPSPVQQTLPGMSEHGTAGWPALDGGAESPSQRRPCGSTPGGGGKRGNLHAAVSAWGSGIKFKHFLPFLVLTTPTPPLSNHNGVAHGFRRPRNELAPLIDRDTRATSCPYSGSPKGTGPRSFGTKGLPVAVPSAVLMHGSSHILLSSSGLPAWIGVCRPQGTGSALVAVPWLSRTWAEDLVRGREFVIMVVATSKTCRSDGEKSRIRRRSSYLETPRSLVTKPGIVEAAACNGNTRLYPEPLDDAVVP
ncbi:uncharacterized protein B0H64DRAFT_152803 [Chaetomium fimeti]|uniref:Uncharacterized protein n=1 Tax=Chaetomium fimeti TaxID=1854472 RepID=A0AAE0LSD5_9PEZI|nr:hypothetical protein B0H64DRAFT_152803 [Chaetomium fimeti]